MINNIDIEHACVANIVRIHNGAECIVFVARYTGHVAILNVVDIDDACIVARDARGTTYTIAIEFECDTYRYRMINDDHDIDLTSRDGIVWG